MERGTPKVELRNLKCSTADVARWTLSALPREFLHPSADRRTSRRPPRVARGAGVHVCPEALHIVLRAKGEAERRRLREGAEGAAPGKGNRGVRTVPARAADFGRGETR